jgi:hypothetical protein
VGLTDVIGDFTACPNPLWNNELARQLVNAKLKIFSANYSLTSCILKNVATNEKTIFADGIDSMVFVLPSDEIAFFFNDHGLAPLTAGDSFGDAIAQITKAIAIFDEMPSIKVFITQIVRSICILKAEDPDIDVSYSHPDIPFSIFVSVIDQPSSQTTLRVAESILHEAMHLFLTLIEGVLPMVNQDSKETFYSPWRDEPRPIRGVLHGLFVFKAISEFYNGINRENTDLTVLKFLNNRIMSIKKEIKMLSGFSDSPGLTLYGSKLASNLQSEGFSGSSS